jgi:excisionase family DNA binding protein
MNDTILLTTREVARYLKVNEKKVYTLINEQQLPATKVTGKWVFPKHLVTRWLENKTINHPDLKMSLPPYHGLTIISGSNDILLEHTIPLFNKINPDHIAVFGNLGSMGGIRSLGRNLCHIAASHLFQQEDGQYNFDFARKELGQLPAVVNFCRREQGLLVAKGNPRKIRSISDLRQPEIRIANRPVGTGTRLLFDQELIRSGIKGESIDGYSKEFQRHLDVGLEIVAGRADAAPCIRAVAGILELDFIPLRWERFDFLIKKEMFFEQGIQLFLGLLHEEKFHRLAAKFSGYDLTLSAKMVFPQDPLQNKTNDIKKSTKEIDSCCSDSQ